ncbi:SMI1/KNR4 family protein [Streptosporangium sp. NBC_01639]|uniref:SMI1/KNR4 family protein n=1 Tax=Streptosporangium sp. NBC_01639 TaxID=2975948 RepID=UPI003864FE01|nr:SMI1/KNR4 family protein [Streptosporangium sp. NBC_01639]
MSTSRSGPSAPEDFPAVADLRAVAAEHRRTDFDVFGAYQHRYRFPPPLDDAALEVVEARIGLCFPADYRMFLTRLGNGGPGPYYGVHGVRPDGAWTRFRPFPFTEKWEPPDQDDEDYDDVMEAAFEGLLPVAEHGCGYRSHLVVNGSAAGQVWSDETCVGEALVPEAESFGEWYHRWLESSLREALGKRIEATVHDETGWSIDRRLLRLLPPPLAIGDEGPEGVLRLLRRAYPALYECRHGDARDILARARAVGAPANYEVRISLGEAVLLREEGRIADALTTVEHTIPRCGRPLDSARLHRLRVELLLMRNRLDDARAAADEHIAYCPDDDFGYVRHALLKVLTGGSSAGRGLRGVIWMAAMLSARRLRGS